MNIISVILFLSMLISISGNMLAQTPDTLWSKIHNITIDIDEGQSIRQANDGGFIITGSCVPDGLVSHIDALLLKTDASGEIQWTKTYGRDFLEEGLSVEPTNDGGYIIGGRSVTGTYPMVEPPLSNAWILKTDAAGDTLWTRTYGNSGNDYCTSIQQTPDSGYIFTGTTNAEYCYPKREINEAYRPASASAWLVKIAANGDTLWTKTYQPRSHGNCLAQTADGGYIIVGLIFPDEQDNQSDVLLIKTDSSGDTLWTKIIGGADYEAGFCVRPITDGYVIAGQTKPKGQAYDALLIRTDSSGAVVWSKTFGGDLSDVAFSIDASEDGFFVSGVTNGTWWVTALGDMWAFMTDVDGNVLWERSYNIRACDIAWSSNRLSDGDYLLTGMTSNGFGGDLWLAKLGRVPTGIQDNPAAVGDYVLSQNYPNPFNPSTTIKYSIPNNSSNLHSKVFISLKVFDILGKEVATLVDEVQSAGNYEIKFSAQDLSSGVYFYRLAIDNYSQTKKMLFLK